MNTSALPPSPQTTLAIILGASAWPNCPEMSASKSFTASAQDFRNYLISQQGLGLPETNVNYDLFDKDINSSDQLDRLKSFIEKRMENPETADSKVRDVLVYFIGHAEYAGEDFYLLPRSAKAGSLLRSSSIDIKALTDIIKEKARLIRLFLVLDCCFSEAAASTLMGALSQDFTRKAEQYLGMPRENSSPRPHSLPIPSKGIALLCSSNKDTTSKFYPDETGTVFSHALLQALRNGDTHRSSSPLLSWYDIKQLTEDELAKRRKKLIENPQPNLREDDIPRPRLRDDEREGEVTKIPFFPNAAFARSQNDVENQTVVPDQSKVGKPSPDAPHTFPQQFPLPQPSMSNRGSNDEEAPRKVTSEQPLYTKEAKCLYCFGSGTQRVGVTSYSVGKDVTCSKCNGSGKMRVPLGYIDESGWFSVKHFIICQSCGKKNKYDTGTYGSDPLPTHCAGCGVIFK